ncbi:unnamed protein product [Cunninghamella blakesleeana]
MGKFQNKKQAPKKQTKKAKEPETFDEFMEEAIGFEEQGERYATGERAERNYERALQMYIKAHALNSQDADCLYNWGRVLFILVGFFPAHTSPEDKLNKLNESIDKFRLALNLELNNKTDVEFNLAQALHLKSEILQEATEIENAYGQSALALQEAISLFDAVYELQEKEYIKNQSNNTEDDKTTTNKEKDEEKDDHDHSQCTEDHHHHHEETETTTTSSVEKKDDNDDKFTTVTEVEPTTSYSLIDTLISTADAMTTMASMMANFEDSKKLFNRAMDKLSRAEKWLADTKETEKEHQKSEIQILLKRGQCYCELADRSFLATRQVDNKLYEQALSPLIHVTESLDNKNIEALCDQGDVYSRYAQAILDQVEQQSKTSTLDPKTNGKQVWQLYSQASDVYQKALKLESKSLSILNKAGDISMARAQLPLPVAERNQTQLLKNAQFYYKQAVEANNQVLTNGWIGWVYATWALEEWAEVDGKEQDAKKIIQSWLKRGGNQELFESITDDNDTIDGGFVEWVDTNFF